MHTKAIVQFLCGVALCATLGMACKPAQRDDPRHLTALVSVEGSDTMSPLVTLWASHFMHADPEVPVSVTTGNTGQGIDALINRTTDVAAASNEITLEQTQRAKKNQVQMKRYVVARDCIAVIVNPANPVKDLSLDQLRGILTGAISNWSQVGGQRAAIKLLIRESTSGTQSFLREHYLKGSPFAKNAQTVLSLNSVIDAVEKDKAAVGYVGMSGAVGAGQKVKVLALKVLSTAKSVKPSPVSTFDDYPLSRPLALYTDENPKPSVEQFVNYCLSPEGQKVASESGFATVHKDGD